MKRLRAWWATRRYGPLTRDRCETCGRPLRERQRVEVTEIIETNDLGGSAMSATYCTEDAPKEAA